MRVLVVAHAANLGVKLVHACRNFAHREVVTPLKGQSIHRTWRASKAHVLPLLEGDRFDGDPIASSVEAVGRLAGEQDAIIVAADVRATKFVNAMRGQLPDLRYGRTIPTPLLGQLDNKAVFADLLAEVDCPEPDTALVQTADELRESVAKRHCPVVVKPPAKAGGLGVVYLEDEGALERYIEEKGNMPFPLVVQNHVPGRDLGVSVYAEGGKVVAMTSQVWVEADTVEYIRHDRAEALASRIVEHFRLDGPMNFDLRENKDGEVYFLECNPRFWSTLNLAVALGANFVELAVRRAAGEDFVIPRPAHGRRMTTLRGLPRLLSSPGRLKLSSRAAIAALLLDVTDLGAFSARGIEHIRQRMRVSPGVKPGAGL